MLVKASSVTKLTIQGSYTITQLNNTDKPPVTTIWKPCGLPRHLKLYHPKPPPGNSGSKQMSPNRTGGIAKIHLQAVKLVCQSTVFLKRWNGEERLQRFHLWKQTIFHSNSCILPVSWVDFFNCCNLPTDQSTKSTIYLDLWIYIIITIKTSNESNVYIHILQKTFT